jgi:hypothetical protein
LRKPGCGNTPAFSFIRGTSSPLSGLFTIGQFVFFLFRDGSYPVGLMPIVLILVAANSLAFRAFWKNPNVLID